MATDVTIGGSGTLFVGEDKTLRLELLDENDLPVNMAGWTMLFDVREKDNSSAALLSKVPSVTGAYNAARAANTQRAEVTLTDDDLAATIFKGSNLTAGAKTYRHSWKRMDAGNETVLSRGDFSPEKATVP